MTSLEIKGKAKFFDKTLLIVYKHNSSHITKLESNMFNFHIVVQCTEEDRDSMCKDFAKLIKRGQK